VQVIRAINFALFWPVLTRTGEGFTLREGVVGVWSGLRCVIIHQYMHLDIHTRGKQVCHEVDTLSSKFCEINVVVSWGMEAGSGSPFSSPSLPC